jgi:hypothetical protein
MERGIKKMKTPEELIKEIAVALSAPYGILIEIVEQRVGPNQPNWVATAAPLAPGSAIFSATVAALNKSDPIINWSSSQAHVGPPHKISRLFDFRDVWMQDGVLPSGMP